MAEDREAIKFASCSKELESALDSIHRELRKLMEKWLPTLAELGFLNELESGHVKTVISFEVTSAHLVVLNLCTRHSLAALSPREHEVARLVRQGKSNKEIANALRISPQTVATHLKKAYAKLKIHSRLLLAQDVRLLS